MNAVLQCLIEMDHKGLREVWASKPGFPVPKSDFKMIGAMHMARTASIMVPMPLRFYSHAWLRDHGLTSLLPDQFKPRAERMYPVQVSAVGISANSKYPQVKFEIGGAMHAAVMEAHADGKLEDDAHVKKRMMEAREKARKSLML